ncbi:MAG: hypothetical protein K9N35_00215 [Candidatus Marinimicrobia bacterium]|nr:hypothetical protein [Candidatus Neomarinimicrobiota bacterium]
MSSAYGFGSIASVRKMKCYALAGLLLFFFRCEHSGEKQSNPAHVLGTNSNHLTLDNASFPVKGVVYVPFAPGYLPWQFEFDDQLPSILQDRINQDIDSIKALGVNTIRLWGAPKYCYKRIAQESDILILQTIWLDSEHEDFRSSEFLNSSKTVITDAISKIFSIMDPNDPVILAYLLGNELSRQSILSTNQAHPGSYAFAGEYIQTDSTLTATELTLAELADYLKQVVVSFTSVEPLVSYSNELRTFDILDTPFLDFRSYNVYSYAVDYYVKNHVPGSSSGTITQGFIETLKSKHPDMPLLITETGLSVSPLATHVGPPNYGYGGNTETEQAEGILQTIQDIETASPPIAGLIVHEFNDAWWKYDLEDSYTQDPADIEEWFGIVGFTGDLSNWQLSPRKAYTALRMHWNN